MNAQIGKDKNKFCIHNSSNRNGEHLTELSLEKGTNLILNSRKRKGKLYIYNTSLSKSQAKLIEQQLIRQNLTLFINSLLLGWYIDSNASLTIQCSFCRTIYLWPQTTPQFLISLLHWSKISFPRGFFWYLQTANSCWGSDLENGVGAEAIQSAIHVVLPSLWSNCDMVHCLNERVLFFSNCGCFLVISSFKCTNNAI